MSKVFIGTSGWVYESWEGIFYPAGLSSREKLKYFAKHFKTTEVNYSFYHLPEAKVFKNWKEQVPKNFIFSLKASRYLSHIKRLKRVKKPFQTFLSRAENLDEKLGPILFQLPPSFKIDLKRLETFLEILPNDRRFVFEFRHPSWFTEPIYKLLQSHRVALCVADSPNYPKEILATTSFVYIRMHGSRVLFSSDYTEEELKETAGLVKNFLAKGKDVYVYFNNDAQGFAVKNSKELLSLMKTNEYA